jgi:hypothetical protein
MSALCQKQKLRGAAQRNVFYQLPTVADRMMPSAFAPRSLIVLPRLLEPPSDLPAKQRRDEQ